MIERNLVDVLALLASIEARDETSALVDRIEARHVYFFTLEEERSTQDRASADQQGMHREGTNPTYRSSYGSWISSKMYSCGSCFLWSCFSSQNFGDVFPCTKKSMMKKRYVFAKKNVCDRDAIARSAHDHRIREMAQTRLHCPTQMDRIQAKRRSVWGRALELALQVGP